MRPLILVALVLLMFASVVAEAGELSARLGLGLNVSSLSTTLLWSPHSGGRLSFIVGAGYWQRNEWFSCSNCLETNVELDMIPLQVGGRLHAGDQTRRGPNLYLEASPTVVLARGVFRPNVVALSEGITARIESSEYLLLGGSLGVLAPIRLSDRTALQLGVSYLFTQGFERKSEVPNVPDQEFDGVRILAVQAGIGWH